MLLLDWTDEFDLERKRKIKEMRTTDWLSRHEAEIHFTVQLLSNLWTVMFMCLAWWIPCKRSFNRKIESFYSHKFLPHHLQKAHCKIALPDLPNCWIALSALQGSSRVMCTLRLWFFTLLSACREIPELAASEIMATNCSKQVCSYLVEQCE